MTIIAFYTIKYSYVEGDKNETIDNIDKYILIYDSSASSGRRGEQSRIRTI